MKIVSLLYLSLFSFIGFTQTYLHPTVGINGEFVGSCLESTCSGTYLDNGNGGNYSNNINAIYRVFCPNTAGNCVTMTFNSFDVETYSYFWGWGDYLTVGNGPSQNSTWFTSTGGSDANGLITGTPGTPFSYTSTHASGCLTTRFVSDGSVSRPGWSATISCTPCAGGPTGTTNADCSGLTEICSSQAVPSNSNGPGIIAEGCNGTDCPAGGENHTNWYAFKIETTGTLAITISPTVITDDYDFALYGPNVDCSTLGAPIRCSDASVTGLTGMANGFGDFSEDATGNGAVEDVDVTAGEVYVLMIDEWTPTGSGYDLFFTGTATFDCNPLPVGLDEFYADYNQDEDIVDLFWSTKSEMNNNYFDLEVSKDGKNFEKIATAQGAGNSSYVTRYMSFDTQPKKGINYYRLKQVDFNGKEKYLKTISIYVEKTKNFSFSIQPNPTNSIADIIFDNDEDEIVILEVINYSGHLIQSNKISAHEGINSYRLNLNDEPDGVYILVLTSSSGSHQTKIIKRQL